MLLSANMQSENIENDHYGFVSEPGRMSGELMS